MSTPPTPTPETNAPAAPRTPIVGASGSDEGGFWTNMFVVDSRIGQPEFAKILSFVAVIVLMVYQGYALIKQNAVFDPVAFAHAIAIVFAGVAAHIGVSEYFRQRFDSLNGIKRDADGGALMDASNQGGQ